MSNEKYMFDNPESTRECAYNELLMMGEDPMDAWAAMEMMDFADDYEEPFEDDDDCEMSDEEMVALIESWGKYDAPSCTYGDYSPSNPWDAPGMSVRDFI